MKHSERFTNAVTKLYNAFHEDRLNSMDCKACAVGNICDNSSLWAGEYEYPKSGYSRSELMDIENIFMFGDKDADNLNETPWRAFEVKSYKENNKVFESLCAVIEYLCELEGIPNVMDYQRLFETENNEAKYELIW